MKSNNLDDILKKKKNSKKWKKPVDKGNKI